MTHYGDITKLNGADLPIVDIITGGSPCQDLSVAGKRAGLAGERSGLFMEQIRIIKEMREHDRRIRAAIGADDDFRLVRPRYMVWENVPGAFSSNNGEDFRAVLEETAHIADENAVIPRPPGKWGGAGCILGDGWSIAWRVHDAQFWGVPQRRRRIALVADFGGQSAPKVLFECEGMPGDTATLGKEGESAAAGATNSTGAASEFINGVEDFINAVNKDAKHQQDLIQSDLGVARALTAGTHGSSPHLTKTLITSYQDRCGKDEGGKDAKVYGISSFASNAMKSSNPHSGVYEADTARTLDLNDGSPACNQGGMAVVQGADVYNGVLTGDVAATLTEACGGTNTSGAKVVCIEGNGQRESHKGDGYKESDVMYTLNTVEQHAVCYRKTGHARSAEDGQGWAEADVNDTLNTTDNGESRTPTVIVQPDKARALTARADGSPCADRGPNIVMVEEQDPIILDSNQNHAGIHRDGLSPALPAAMGMGGGYVPMVVQDEAKTIYGQDVTPTLVASIGTPVGNTQDGFNVVIPEATCMDVGWLHSEKDKAPALLSRQYKDPPITYQDKTDALMASSYNKLGTQEAANDRFVTDRVGAAIVRRLTPKECERLQGFPDDWTNIGEWVDSKGKTHKDADSPRYKALGNSIALPFWQWMAERMVKYIDHRPTMASLFDGIGGFPLVFSRCGCDPVWSSEIEEFPIAVTKIHFPET